MAASKGGGVTIELTEQSKKNIDLQMAKLKKLAPEAAKKGMFKLLVDIKSLAQNKLRSDEHIKSSRLRNSLYVQSTANNKHLIKDKDNSESYTDKDGKSYSRKLDVDLTNNEGAVGTNVEYAGAIEYGYGPHTIEAKNFPVLGNKNVGFFGKKVQHPGFAGDSFLYWASKNVDLNKRWREVSKELLGDLSKQGRTAK